MRLPLGTLLVRRRKASSWGMPTRNACCNWSSDLCTEGLICNTILINIQHSFFSEASFYFNLNQAWFDDGMNSEPDSLTPPTRLNFPRGFPDEYSFMTTFRMIKNTVNKVWNVWQIVDEDGNKQAGLRLNGDQQSLEYFLMGADGNLQTVTFPGISVLFNTKWHKVMIGVERGQITLYVDCQPVDQKPIKGKGPINTEGDTLIGRLEADPDASVVVRGDVTLPAAFSHVRCFFSHALRQWNTRSGFPVRALSSAVL